jgi:hypothetical protein
MRSVERRPSFGDVARRETGVSDPLSRHLLPQAGEGIAHADGRQSETALQIARGVRRLLRARGYASVTELPLLDGRRADIVALAADGALLIVEIKSTVADFRADQKWRDYAAHCDRLYFAISDTMPREIMPDEAGLIVADRYGAEIVREAEARMIAPATRRGVLLRFAIAAADRLHRLVDPNGGGM